MSRFRKFAQSLVSGYVQMAANVLFTFVSVPLALHYLSKAEFGLWALSTQIVTYLMLLDFGLSGAAMRILIDYKDDPNDPRYGSLILTGMLVNAAHFGIILLAGVTVAQVLPPLLDLPAGLKETFRWLMIWQGAVMSLCAAYRTPVMILTAHQRYDVVNIAQTLSLAVNLAVLWLGFARGGGIFSMVWGQAAAHGLNCLWVVWGCGWLGLFPKRGRWGRPTWDRFRELFVYGRDMFLYLLGNLLISASQTILITRVLGLEASAVWSVCTRAFVLLNQVLNRLFDFSIPAFAEMIVRGEHERLFHRFRSLITLTASVGAVAAVGLAAVNRPFVRVWTHDRINGPPVFLTNDLRDPGLLVRQLTERPDDLAQFVWEQLSPRTREQLIAYGSTGADSPGLLDALAAELNALIQGGSIYDSRRFAGINLTPETRKRLRSSSAGESALRLNRMLLEDAYPEALARNRTTWPVLNDALLGLWLIVLVLVRNHAGLVGLVKDFRFLRYLLLVEGAVAIGLGYLALHLGGITWMLGTSLLASLTISLPYGIWRTARYFGLSWPDVSFRWIRPAGRLIGLLAPPAALAGWIVWTQPAPLQLLINSLLIAALAVPLLPRLGLDELAHRELGQRFPIRGKWIERLIGRRPS